LSEVDRILNENQTLKKENKDLRHETVEKDDQIKRLQDELEAHKAAAKAYDEIIGIVKRQV